MCSFDHCIIRYLLLSGWYLCPCMAWFWCRKKEALEADLWLKGTSGSQSPVSRWRSNTTMGWKWANWTTRCRAWRRWRDWWARSLEMGITNYAVVISHCLSGMTWCHKALKSVFWHFVPFERWPPNKVVNDFVFEQYFKTREHIKVPGNCQSAKTTTNCPKKASKSLRIDQIRSDRWNFLDVCVLYFFFCFFTACSNEHMYIRDYASIDCVCT